MFYEKSGNAGKRREGGVWQTPETAKKQEAVWQTAYYEEYNGGKKRGNFCIFFHLCIICRKLCNGYIRKKQ